MNVIIITTNRKNRIRYAFHNGKRVSLHDACRMVNCYLDNMGIIQDTPNRNVSSNGIHERETYKFHKSEANVDYDPYPWEIESMLK